MNNITKLKKLLGKCEKEGAVQLSRINYNGENLTFHLQQSKRYFNVEDCFPDCFYQLIIEFNKESKFNSRYLEIHFSEQGKVLRIFDFPENRTLIIDSDIHIEEYKRSVEYKNNRKEEFLVWNSDNQFDGYFELVEEYFNFFFSQLHRVSDKPPNCEISIDQINAITDGIRENNSGNGSSGRGLEITSNLDFDSSKFV